MSKYKEINIIDDAGCFASFTTRCTTANKRRESLAREAEEFGGSVAWPYLVHGTNIVQLKKEDLGKSMICFEETDGCITDVPGIALTVTCGDCLPVYAWDPVHRAVGIAHAGWRGTLLGIAAELVMAMNRAYGSLPDEMTVRIGPGIDPCCFKVKEDCYGQFLDKYPWAEDYLYEWPDGSHSLDIKGINLEILTLSGVEDASASPLCTSCEKDLFYSWRRSAERDRMLAYIYLKEEKTEDPGFVPPKAGALNGSGKTRPGSCFKPPLAVSRCLLGEPCRYDGRSKPSSAIDDLRSYFRLVPVCPEQLGGLPTPRNASEICGEKVMMKVQNEALLAEMPKESQRCAAHGCLLDVTEEYRLGAEKALERCAAAGAFTAVLKSKSPSCGAGKIYDGSFSGVLTDGNGVFARLLLENGFEVVTEKQICDMI